MIYDNIYALFGGLWGYEGSKHCRKEDGQWIYILNLVCYSLKQLLTYCAWFINSQENFSDSQQCLSFQMSVVLLMNKAEFSLPLGLHVYTPCQV